MRLEWKSEWGERLLHRYLALSCTTARRNWVPDAQEKNPKKRKRRTFIWVKNTHILNHIYTLHTCTHTFMHAHTHTHTCKHTCVHTHTHAYTHSHACVHMHHTYTHKHACVHTHACTHTCTYTNARTHTCMHSPVHFISLTLNLHSKRGPDGS